MMRSNALQQPPQGKNVFQLSDTDGNGTVSSTELESLASAVEETTGSTINVNDAISSYDSDQDGALNGEELLQMMTGMGFSPPEMASGESGKSSEMPPPPPPPPSSEEVTSAYSRNSGDSMLPELLDLLQSEQNSDADTYSSVNVTS